MIVVYFFLSFLVIHYPANCPLAILVLDTYPSSNFTYAKDLIWEPKDHPHTLSLLDVVIFFEPVNVSMAIIFFSLTFIKIHQNRHILSETRKKAELSIIYQNVPIILSFIFKYLTALVIYFIRVKYDDRDSTFASIICNDFTNVTSVFPTIYTFANFKRLRTDFSKCCCCLKWITLCKRGNRISDQSLQYMSTTRHAMDPAAAPPPNN
ncbi:unnamed protein product [Caenorhabditis angaria]|uniref:G-protein coupled receptors family 1 profile domain-containing protein n=1 Tax=Caenorhabditis angaria TaxID=860376 RepID=A0A9P1NB41_9PELO|nr:unnamed protein product [Caenorhabditis angaria]